MVVYVTSIPTDIDEHHLILDHMEELLLYFDKIAMNKIVFDESESDAFISSIYELMNDLKCAFVTMRLDHALRDHLLSALNILGINLVEQNDLVAPDEYGYDIALVIINLKNAAFTKIIGTNELKMIVDKSSI
jgi:hypothetical protein